MTTITDTRRDLDATRRKHGKHSPTGSRCSMLIEQIPNYQEATDPHQRAYLAASMRKNMGEIAGPDLHAEER